MPTNALVQFKDTCLHIHVRFRMLTFHCQRRIQKAHSWTEFKCGHRVVIHCTLVWFTFRSLDFFKYLLNFPFSTSQSHISLKKKNSSLCCRIKHTRRREVSNLPPMWLFLIRNFTFMRLIVSEKQFRSYVKQLYFIVIIRNLFSKFFSSSILHRLQTDMFYGY